MECVWRPQFSVYVFVCNSFDGNMLYEISRAQQPAQSGGELKGWSFVWEQSYVMVDIAIHQVFRLASWPNIFLISFVDF